MSPDETTLINEEKKPVTIAISEFCLSVGINSQSVSQSVGWSVSQSVGWSVSQSVSRSVGQQKIIFFKFNISLVVECRVGQKIFLG